MYVRSNLSAMQGYLDFKKIDGQFSASMARLSSGLKAPTPNAGSEWVVANDMEALYREQVITSEHMQNGRGILEIAQTALMEVSDMVLRMDELAHRAASEEINSAQRIEMSAEMSTIRDNIDSIFAEVRYNDLSVWSTGGLGSKTWSIHVGRSAYIEISTFNVSDGDLGYSSVAFSGGTLASADQAISVMASSIITVNKLMAQMGAQIRQVEAKVNILDEQAVQQKAMAARVNELDFAQEMKTFTGLQVVLQASNAMLAQANMKSQMVLQLFGG